MRISSSSVRLSNNRITSFGSIALPLRREELHQRRFAELFGQDGQDVRAPLIARQRLTIGSGGRNLGRRIEPQEFAPLFAAAQNHLQIPRITTAVLYHPLGTLGSGRPIDDGRLRRLL